MKEEQAIIPMRIKTQGNPPLSQGLFNQRDLQ